MFFPRFRPLTFRRIHIIITSIYRYMINNNIYYIKYLKTVCLFLQLLMYTQRRTGVLGGGKTTLKNKLKYRYIGLHKRRVIFKYTTDDVERSTAETYIWTRLILARHQKSALVSTGRGK